MIGTYHSLHFIVAEASHREVNYLVRDHAESKTRAKIKNAVHLDPELALFNYYISLHIAHTRCEEEEDRYTGHRVSIKKLPKNHKWKDLRKSYTEYFKSSV